MTTQKIIVPVSVIAAGYVGPSLAPNEDASWREADLPYNCDALVLNVLGQPMRRAGRFIKMVCAGALSCLKSAPSDAPKSAKTGIFLATGLGNGDEILPFVTQVFKHDGGFPSPNQFANSVSNAAAFFLARLSGVKGVVLTVSDEELSFESALWLAQSYLAAGEIDLALVGGCDVYTPTIEEYRERMYVHPDNARDLPIGEGSSWLLLGMNSSSRIGEIRSVRMHAKTTGPADIFQDEEIALAVGRDAAATRRLWLPGFRMMQPAAPPGWECADYLPCCGIHPTASAFGLARALLREPGSVLLSVGVSTSGKKALVVAAAD